MHPRPGSPAPLGATWDGQGVNFALYSQVATGVELCLFDEAGFETRIPLRERTGLVWHGWLAGVGPGQTYGYRVLGPYDPARGLRCNGNVLLLDPYAKALDSVEDWDAGLFAYDASRAAAEQDADLARRDADARGVPLSVVIDPAFDWQDDRPPATPLHRTVVYETHVKGLTMLHPEVPAPLRGRYGGVASEAMLRHFKQLGVTAVELQPVHAFVDDRFVLDRGLRNYWGYNSIGFFAPDVRYRAGSDPQDAVREFKAMVRDLHKAGLEVLLDVVYNHTAEGNHLGPTLSFKGIDNPTYYRLSAESPRFYDDCTGTGNTVDGRHPQVVQLVLDSLRYWIQDMHVDGFRFDLAPALARGAHGVEKWSAFLSCMHQDPLISRVKLIAEPWDLGEGGYQLGQFPVRWAEWNDRYRDTVRAFWRGDGGLASELGFRLTGSSDLYEDDGRAPTASVNFVTAHDGFTLADLVTYETRHNEANGEDNRDGAETNLSWNCGVEGPSDDPTTVALRQRQVRNLMATLLFSQGTPMLLGGDELGRTQGGNNNAWCQDNAVTWYDWGLDGPRRAFLEFTCKVVALRKSHPCLHRSRFLKGRRIRGDVMHDIQWFRTDGREMLEMDWQTAGATSLGLFLSGKGIDEIDADGAPIRDDDLVLLLHAGDTDVDFVLPDPARDGIPWRLLLDTADDAAQAEGVAGEVASGGTTRLVARSLKLFARSRPGGPRP